MPLGHEGVLPARPDVRDKNRAHTDSDIAWRSVAQARISVDQQLDGTFKVEVRVGRTTTRHIVTVPEETPVKLGCDHVALDELVRASFAFLVEREPPTSILRRFSLTQITDYFPEYPQEIRRRTIVHD